MEKKNSIKTLSIQLWLTVVLLSYVLNLFQNNFFILSHKISHKFSATFKNLNEHHHTKHTFLNLESSTKKHTHFHKQTHNHDVLSFFKTILNDHHKEIPFSKNKKKQTVDKHITQSIDLANYLPFLCIDHNYTLTNNLIPITKLSILGPPPKLFTT